MKNILLLLILFTGLVSWGQDYDIYLNSFHSEDQSKPFQKFTYKIPEHVNSVQLNFDPRVVPDAFYVKYGDQEFWSGFVGDIYKKGGGLYKMMSVPENIKNRYYKDIYPSNLYENQKNENSRIVDAFPRNFVGELVWYKQNDGLLEFINTEISQVGGNSINSIFKNGDGNAENITNGIKNTQTPLRDIYDSYGNVLKGETSFTLKKESGEDEITIMVFSPLHGRLFDVLINTCETCQEPTKDISEIEFKDSKILLNGSTYDGVVTERYNQEQLKSVKRVKNGLITSEIIYHEDKNYKSNLSNFKNIEVITSKTEQLGIMDYQIDKLIKEGENQLSQRDHLKENEMGDKFEKYQEKYNEGNLKGKKLELFNAYLKHKNNYEETTKKIKSDKKSRDEFKNSLFKEMKKPFYQLISKESFNYTNGQKTGIHKEYDKNEKLVLEEELKDGVRNGSYKRYENGEIEVEGIYINNKKDGLWTLYYDGWKEEISYSNDLMNGDYKKYYGEVVVKEGQYSNGLMNGEWIYRYDSGSLKGQGNYIEGDGENVGSSGIPKNGREGEFLLFHENGNKSQIGSFVNGKEDGEFIIYHDNGNKNHVGSYRNGKRVGEHIY
ncbi:MAG: toxin-antitoxin system YwqK family antitoxin, partial [Promethearchaeota archaeon]